MFSMSKNYIVFDSMMVPPQKNIFLLLYCIIFDNKFLLILRNSKLLSINFLCVTLSHMSIDEGAVAPWNSLMWSLMTDVCREMGVRTDVPFRELTDREKEIVYHGPAEKKHIFYKAKKTNQAGELDFTYFNAVYTVENALAKVKDEKGMKRVEKFLKEHSC